MGLSRCWWMDVAKKGPELLLGKKLAKEIGAV